MVNSLKVIEDMIEFDDMILLIKTNFPKCKKWLDWYLHSDRAREYPNTNAEESMGNVVQLSCEQKQPTISQLYLHLFMLASKHDAKYVAACQGYETQYPTRKKNETEVTMGELLIVANSYSTKPSNPQENNLAGPKGPRTWHHWVSTQSTLIKQ
jgi:hypothetical protein